MTQQAAAEATYEQKYLVIAVTEGDGKFEKPQIIKVSELENEQAQAAKATGGTWGVHVISEFTLTHWEF